MARIPTIGRAESEVLRFIADHPKITVGEVAEHFAEEKGNTRNTIHNVMERLRAKGFLERTKEDGVYRYSPCIGKGPLMEGVVAEFVQTVLGGSLSPLVAYLTHQTEVTDEQRKELERLIESLKETPNAS
jgi:predicted transcriptional regulator